MFVGHYGASFAAKAADKRIPLGLLFLAAQLLDVLWATFVLLGFEKVRIVPGITAASPLDLYYMPYTHSLAGAIGWSLFAFLLCQLFSSLKGARRGLIIALVVFSHWILDLLVHRPDLPLFQGIFKMGFGLWNHRMPAFILEIGVLVGGAALYLRTVSRKGRAIGFVGILLLAQVAATFFFPPPGSDREAASTALFCYILFAGIAWWVDKSTERLAATRISR